jgi:hypothetical protein
LGRVAVKLDGRVIHKIIEKTRASPALIHEIRVGWA